MTNLDKYKSHIDKGGGMPQGYRFTLCLKCKKHGVSSRIISKTLIRKACKYCGWIEGIKPTSPDR